MCKLSIEIVTINTSQKTVTHVDLFFSFIVIIFCLCSSKICKLIIINLLVNKLIVIKSLFIIIK